MKPGSQTELSPSSRGLLEDVLAGEIAATAPAVLAAIAADPAFALELERMLPVHQELIRRALTAPGARPMPAAPELEALAADTIRARATGIASPPPRTRTWRRWLLLAAVLTLALLAVWRLQDERPRERQQLDGSIAIAELADGSGLHFDFNTGPEISFEVQVLADGKPLAPARRERTPDWRPSADEIARWPATVRIEVTAMMGTEAVAHGAFTWQRRR